MNRADDMMTLLDAWLLSERGEDPSKAIENQEKRGQAEVVRTQSLPKKINDHNVPREIFWAGVPQTADYDTKRAITTENVENYTKAEYKKMGIKIISEADDLFWNVKLPKGWEIKATDHSMWNEVRDTYEELKNLYLRRGDRDHPSFVVYVEAVNQVYQTI